MSAPKGNQYAKNNKGGNPGHGVLSAIKAKVGQHHEDWWRKWEEMMNSGDKDYVKLAFSEFNKLQTKYLPTVMEDDEGNKVQPVLVQIIGKENYENTDTSRIRETT